MTTRKEGMENWFGDLPAAAGAVWAGRYQHQEPDPRRTVCRERWCGISYMKMGAGMATIHLLDDDTRRSLTRARFTGKSGI